LKNLMRGLFFLITLSLAAFPYRPVFAKAPVLLAGENKLGLRALDVKVEVIEDISRTTLDLTFFNNEDRQLEGTLFFPLPAGAAISGFGMYFGDKLRPGVVVEKEKGRVVYEAIKRRRIDPALVELESGNNFKTRVFPIPPKGEKRVQVVYEEDLTSKQGSRTYVLPLDYGFTVRNFRLKLTVKGQDATQVTPSGAWANKLLLRKSDEGGFWEGALNEEEAELKDVLRIAIRTSPEKDLSVWTEREEQGVSYFRVSYRPGLGSAARSPAANLLILWDTSLSGLKRDLDKDLAFLEALLGERMNSARFRLALFNITATALSEGYEPLTKEAIPGILKSLRESVYDGATDFGAILKTLPDLLAKGGKTDVVVFSDFVQSYSGQEAVELIHAAVESGAVFYPVNSAPATNPAFASKLVGASGGVATNLLASEDTKGALAAIKTAPPYLTGIVAPTWTDEIYPKTAQPASGSVVFAGRYTRGGRATFLLTFSENGRKITREISMELPEEPAEGDLLKKAWVKSKIGELSASPVRYAKEIISLGKTYSVVTPYTSLIVLDGYEDYRRFGITPPADVVKEWEERQKAASPEEAWSRSARLPGPPPGGPPPEPSRSQIEVPPSAVVPPSPSIDYSMSEGRAHMADVGSGGGWVAPSVPIPTPRPPAGPSVEVRVEPAYYERLLKDSLAESPEAAYQTYLKLRKESGSQIPFYLFAADLLHEQNQVRKAELILSNIIELHPDTAAYVRVFAHRIRQWGETAKAVPFFRRIVMLRGEEPQSYRDLGMALAAVGEYRDALVELQTVLDKNWDSRFKDIQTVLRQDIGWIAGKLLRGLPKDSDEYLEVTRKYLEGYEAPELRVTITWDADNTDIDLWVTEPSGEKCYYGNRKTKGGGQMTDDLTMGYGPEAYTLREAAPGAYKVQVHYFSGDRTIQYEGTSVQVTVIKYPGTEREEITETTAYLKKNKQVVDIATVAIGK
jgi:Ca-activated chloride channel family protein